PPLAGRLSPAVLPRPPPPTVCPYTTLFRSRLKGQYHEWRKHQSNPYRDIAGLAQRDAFGLGGPDSKRALHPVHARRIGAAEVLQDRKSTRLNSSHVKTSYAGSCLQKRNRHR